MSTDDGKTFSPVASVPGTIKHFLAKDGMRIGKKLLVTVSYHELDGDVWIPDRTDPEYRTMIWGRENHSEYCGVLIKEDGNDVWRLSGHVGRKGCTFTEPVFTRLSDGTIVMLMRLNGDHRIYKTESRDEGETWSAIEDTGIPSAISKACLLKDSKGRIYLLFNPGPTRRREPLVLWVSDDDMKTWSKKVPLIMSDEPDAKATYPDGFLDEERGMLCFGWENRFQVYYSEYSLSNLEG